MSGRQVQTFHSQIAANRRRSLLLIASVFVLLAVLGLVIGYAATGVPEGGYLAVGIAVAVAAMMTSVSWFAGDSIVLAASQARQVSEHTHPQLMNVVRELSIAANIPPPQVYLIEDSAPNAFATGRDPQRASIAVTTGLLDKLDREELQGVIGHELSHVRNLDIRFALLVGVLVGSIVLLADFFLRFTFWGGGRSSGGSRSSRGGGSGGGGLMIILFIVAIVLAIVAPIAARLVQMAVSRQREYLADASAVELTRNPYGLERALLKIGGDREPLEVANRATQHLYFVNPLKKMDLRSSSLMSTHPPILERVNRLRALTGGAPLDLRALSSQSALR
ncbi:MAG TPA: M48 family metallopeptidase [Candidatus Limnocylindrales bacterium]|nr:M48 family metallopeptidase [Candidatus Limnocylindrales bacterium]